MPNTYFQFKHFKIQQDRCAMKVTTDACLFGAWASRIIKNGDSLKSKTLRALDIGAGTGVLSLMLAQDQPQIEIDAIELDEAAFEQARENFRASPFASQLKVVHGDVKHHHFTKNYDLVISNPPFYEHEIISATESKNVARHQSGLLLEELFHVIKRAVSPDGNFYLLLPYKRQDEIKKILIRQNLSISQILFVRQSTKHNYFRTMLSGQVKAPNGLETKIEEISIWGDNKEYTTEFKDLLSDFYLYL